MEHIPWVEKYRPVRFEDIVLEETNKNILNNIVEKNYFPNLLFYGPPGTGKTTTIINLIDKYQERYNQKRKGLKIHLNASDDRGIDVIRNQINQFVNTKTLFGNGLKFVILDEVDYMTKNAQQALRYLIQQYSENIRFCLICNYISRIDVALQNEFIRLRFCQLPENDISYFLSHIIKNEKINITNKQMLSIQSLFKSDIRSMINYLQSNQHNLKLYNKMLTNDFWESFIKLLKEKKEKTELNNFIMSNCIEFNMSVRDFLKEFINYLVFNKECILNNEWLTFFSRIIHADATIDFILNYFLCKICDLFEIISL